MDRDTSPLFVIQLPSVKAHSFQLGALSSSKRFCCTLWEGTWLSTVSLVALCCLMLPKFALITVFLESLGSLHIFAIFGSILSVGGSRKGMVPAFLKFQIAAGDRSCFVFSNQDGLFVISCSLAALYQTTRILGCVFPMLLLAGVVFCFAGIGAACSAFLSLGYSQE